MNPMQQVPVLVLGDGTAIAESVAICRFFEELQPEPALFGKGASVLSLTDDSQTAANLSDSGHEG
jgi:glutathione S-transferase